MMIPVPVLFSTPEDGANELRFLARRNYPWSASSSARSPTDSTSRRRTTRSCIYGGRGAPLVAPRALLGGPSFQGLESQMMMAWPRTRRARRG